MKLYGTQILLQVTLHVCYSAFITEYLYLGIYNLDHQFMGEETGPQSDFLKKDPELLWLSSVCLAAGVMEEGFRHLFALSSLRKSFLVDLAILPATTITLDSNCMVFWVVGLKTWMTGVSGSEKFPSHLTRSTLGTC